MKRISIHFFGMSCMIVAIIMFMVVGTNTNIKFINTENIFIYWLQLMGLFLTVFVGVHLILYNFGNLARAIYFKIHGYSFFPVVLYPFCINWYNNRIKISITLRLQVMFYDFLPNSIVNNDLIGKDAKEDLMKKGIYVKYYSRFCLLLVACIYFGMIHPPYILIAIAIVLELIVFSYVYDRRYHGEKIKIANIKSGDGIMYLIGLNDQYLEIDDEEKLISLYQIVENQNYILSGAKRILLRLIVMNKKEIPLIIENISSHLSEKSRQISLNPDEKELEITILLLCYALLTNDVAEINSMLCVFQSLQKEWGEYSGAWYEYFQWYIEVIQILRGQREEFSVKQQPMIFIKADSIGYMPGVYNDMLRKAENIVNSSITFKRKDKGEGT